MMAVDGAMEKVKCELWLTSEVSASGIRSASRDLGSRRTDSPKARTYIQYTTAEKRPGMCGR